MGSYSDVPTDDLIHWWKDTAEERGSMLEDNRNEDDQDRRYPYAHVERDHQDSCTHY
jgi:hypothetical protein